MMSESESSTRPSTGLTRLRDNQDKWITKGNLSCPREKALGYIYWKEVAVQYFHNCKKAVKYIVTKSHDI
jgi:hypothetical protein